MVVLISKRHDECPRPSLCVESVNRPRLGGNRDQMGTFAPCVASIFFSQGVAGGKLAAAAGPAARQAIDIVVELTCRARAHVSASAQRCGAKATNSVLGKAGERFHRAEAAQLDTPLARRYVPQIGAVGRPNCAVTHPWRRRAWRAARLCGTRHGGEECPSGRCAP